MRATRFVWEAMGRPVPRDSEGYEISQRELPDGSRCAMCGEPAAHLIADAVSDNFTTVTNFSLLYPHGGDSLCPGCLWSFRAIATKAGFYFARQKDALGEGGMFFVGTLPLKGIPGTRPNPLSALLNPPPPPFVAVYPAYGLDHGGEQNLERLTLDHPPAFLVVRKLAEDAERLLAAHVKTAPKSKDSTWKADSAICWALARCAPPQIPFADLDHARSKNVNVDPAWGTWRRAIASDLAWKEYVAAVEPYRLAPWFRAAAYPLIKLQSKHTLPYAQVSHSRERYHLAIDDGPGVMVDVALWQRLGDLAIAVLAGLRLCGVGAEDARAALVRLRLPMLRPNPDARVAALALMKTWPEVTSRLAPHAGATWWPFLVSLLPMPELTKSNPKEKK